MKNRPTSPRKANSDTSIVEDISCHYHVHVKGSREEALCSPPTPDTPQLIGDDHGFPPTPLLAALDQLERPPSLLNPLGDQPSDVEALRRDQTPRVCDSCICRGEYLLARSFDLATEGERAAAGQPAADTADTPNPSAAKSHRWLVHLNSRLRIMQGKDDLARVVHLICDGYIDVQHSTARRAYLPWLEQWKTTG